MTKECTRCKSIKSKSEFNIRSASKDGLQHKCKPCQADLAKKRDSKKLYKEYNRAYSIARKYNLSEEEYDKMMEGDCRICGSNQRLVMDHDHSTGKIRGILCHPCNTGLGLFKDNIESLENAIRYLKNG